MRLTPSERDKYARYYNYQHHYEKYRHKRNCIIQTL